MGKILGIEGILLILYKKKEIELLLKLVKLGDLKNLFLYVNVSLILFFGQFVVAQELYNDCSNALELCPNTNFLVNNISSNRTVCTLCEDNFTNCFTANNTIWLKFQTNALGGNVNVDFSNLVFETGIGQDNEMQASLIQAGAPCDGTSYTFIGNCVTTATTNFSLSANVLANSWYYIVLNGAKNGVGISKAAEFTCNVNLSGIAVDRIEPNTLLYYSTTHCKGQTSNFIVRTTNCQDSTAYKWYINDTLVSVSFDTLFRYSKLKNNDIVRVETTCYTACAVVSSFETENLFVNEFFVEVGEDVSIQLGESVELSGNTNATSYGWTPNSFISDQAILNPVVSPDITTSYFLVADSSGCTQSDEIIVTVSLKLEITNTFSPNADGSNDKWEIPGLVNYPNCLVQIYDRWGQQVFSSTAYNSQKAWDGKRNGKDLNTGTYFYSIELRDADKKVLTGYLNLVR